MYILINFFCIYVRYFIIIPQQISKSELIQYITAFANRLPLSITPNSTKKHKTNNIIYNTYFISKSKLSISKSISTIQNQTMPPLTKKQQYSRIIYLGVSFMLMFTSFNSLQNIVSKLYEEYSYDNLGQTALMFIYGAFGITTVFSSFIVKKLGYKKAMFFSSIGYVVFEATTLLVVANADVAKEFVWFAIILGATVCGVSASVLWVAQGAYTSNVADENRKSQLFGLFWALMMSSQILGNLLITFVLGKMSNLIYVFILIILGGLSTILFLFLPSITKEPAQKPEQNTTLKQQVGKVWAIIKNKKYFYLNIYFWFPGLAVSFYAGFLYKLVKDSLVQEEGQSKQDFDHRVNFSQGLVFITLGFSQLLTGLFMNRFGEKFCKFKLAIVGTLIVEVAAFTSFVCYYTKSFPLSFVCSFLWGAAQNFLQTNTGGLISKIFPGKVEGFSVYRIFFSIGVVTVLLCGIALSKAPGYIFLTIILVLQTIITGVSINLKDLDTTNNRESQQNSLLQDNSPVE